ncbi:MarR family winged helix-turn-helix transcriptional regulator [Amnibacterium endophyticum]|uniref:MarR family winged helix-turn-helix transcriptional regulator n=1 Tax=Amnibacterium endophyticum TaxID=2109337 RepID=A0ABW4LGE3_9MICO
MRDDQALVLEQQLRRFARQQRSRRPRLEGVGDRAAQVLGGVARAGEDASPGAIADALQMAGPNVAAVLRELEEAGLVRRDRDPVDGRRVRLELTPDGEAVVVAHRAARAAWLRVALEQALSPAEQQLLLDAGALLDRVVDADQQDGRR